MKVDVTKIENYDAMTPEEKIAALESFEYETEVPDVQKLKSAVSKANSEAAEWKRKHNALLTDEQRKEEERAEVQKKVEEELAALRKEKSISDTKAKFLSLGYDSTLADETAKAFAEGDMEKVFANQKVYIENIKKAERAAALAGDSRPAPGTGAPASETEKLKKQYDEAVKNNNHVLAFTIMDQIKKSQKQE